MVVRRVDAGEDFIKGGKEVEKGGLGEGRSGVDGGGGRGFSRGRGQHFGLENVLEGGFIREY